MGDGTGGHQNLLVSGQYVRNFSPAPGRVTLAQSQHSFLQRRRALLRTVPRTTGAVLQGLLVTLPRSQQPLVARLPTNSVALTQPAYIASFVTRQHNKLSALLKHTLFLPGHGCFNDKTVTHVPARLLPLCPVYTQGWGKTQLCNPLHIPPSCTLFRRGDETTAPEASAAQGAHLLESCPLLCLPPHGLAEVVKA